MKHLSLGCWSPLLDLREDIRISLGNSFTYVSEIFDDFGYGPDLFIGFQVLLLDSVAVRVFSSGLHFQRKDLHESIIAPLFADYFQISVIFGIFLSLMHLRQTTLLLQQVVFLYSIWAIGSSNIPDIYSRGSGY